MALLTAVFGGGPLDGLCSASASPVGGMVSMYLLMSAFHSAPWLKLIAAGVGKSHGNAICDARGANLTGAALQNGTRPDEARTPKPELRHPSEQGT
jgi:hypothetical protein